MATTIRSAVIRDAKSCPVKVTCVTDASIPAGLHVMGVRNPQDVTMLVSGALASAGCDMPRTGVIVQVTPDASHACATSASLPLAIIAAMLVESGRMPRLPNDVMVGGGVTLAGDVTNAPGPTALRVEAARSGSRLASADTIADLLHPTLVEPAVRRAGEPDGESATELLAKLPTVIAKAVATAVAGHHDLLLVGRDVPTEEAAQAAVALMGDMSDDEAYEVAIAYESCGMLPPDGRPVRRPHASCTPVALAGGGDPVAPGEATLANHGVLVAEDVAELTQTSAMLLADMHKTRSARIVRRKEVHELPADFLLLGAVTPCPCGNFGDPTRWCGCDATHVRRWRSRAIDGAPGFQMIANVTGEGDAAGTKVAAELARQVRFARTAAPSWSDEPEACLSDRARTALDAMRATLGMDGRATREAASVARTIAAMDVSHLATERHVMEALAYVRSGL